MTVREHLTSKKRRTSLATYLGMMGFVVGAIIGGSNRVLLIFGLIGFAVSFLSFGYMVIGIRCPVCHNRIGQLLASVGGPFWVSQSLRCCPFCAVEFDSQLSDARTVQQPAAVDAGRAAERTTGAGGPRPRG